MSLLPNIPPKLFTLSATAVGFILTDDMTANEQNALGNWLMLVAQVLSTNAFYRQVLAERNVDDTNTKNKPNEENDTIIMMQKMINALKEEIENLKHQNKN